MISKEQFQELEYKYGCGYWNVCWEHACPCAVTTEDKGYSEEIYNSLLAESNRMAEKFRYEDENFYDEDDNDKYKDDDRLSCGCCSCCGCLCNNYLEYDDEES